MARNALKHSLRAKGLTFDNEEEKMELELFSAGLEEELEPQGMLEPMLVEEIVSSWWKVRLAEHWWMHELKARRQAAISKL